MIKAWILGNAYQRLFPHFELEKKGIKTSIIFNLGGEIENGKYKNFQTALMVQWLRIRLAMQQTQVPPLF